MSTFRDMNLNELMGTWLKEKWDVERTRGTKAAPTYKKAYESMNSCPLRFNHPSETTSLVGIGPSIAEMLTKKLQQHCDDFGVTMPKKGHKDATRRAELNGLGQPQQNLSPERPAKKAKTTKEYIPKLRSGGYGIMIALAKVGDSTRGMEKEQLIREAQPHCDSSYTVPSEARKSYTAWNSVNSIMEHEYVCAVGGKVKRYMLTEEGREVAARMQAQETSSVASPVKKVFKGTAAAPGRLGSMNEIRPAPSMSRVIEDTNPPRIRKRALDTTSSPHDPDCGTRLAAILRPPGANRFDADVREIVGETTTPPRNRPQLPAVPPLSRPAANQPTAFISPTLTSPRMWRIPAAPASGTTVPEILDLTSSPEPSPKRARSSETRTQTATATSKSLTDSLKHSKTSRSSFSRSAPPLARQEKIPKFTPIVLRPRSFEVQLVLDNREVRTKDDRDYISLKLKENGITPIVRSLELGDAMWIAKIKPPFDEEFLAAHSGDEGDGRTEIALDYIVERKRLDDLVGSIKDGRFHEQKFRLRKSGMKNIVYLIEEYSLSTERQDQWGESLDTAISGMQLIDGFFVKQTTKLDNTIAYLTEMTNMLKEIYEPRQLKVIPSKTLDDQNYASMIASLREKDAATDYYITFDAFDWVCKKSGNLTLRDVYLKMLMCTKGVTGEKAMEIQKIWPTPRALADAYQSANGDKARQCLVSDRLGKVIPRKKVADTLSAKIAELWA